MLKYPSHVANNLMDRLILTADRASKKLYDSVSKQFQKSGKELRVKRELAEHLLFSLSGPFVYGCSCWTPRPTPFDIGWLQGQLEAQLDDNNEFEFPHMICPKIHFHWPTPASVFYDPLICKLKHIIYSEWLVVTLKPICCVECQTPWQPSRNNSPKDSFPNQSHLLLDHLTATYLPSSLQTTASKKKTWLSYRSYRHDIYTNFANFSTPWTCVLPYLNNVPPKLAMRKPRYQLE